MTNVTYLASSDFTLQVEGGEVEFKKGDLVQLEVDKNDDPYLVYHEQTEDGSVKEFELDITTMGVFEGVIGELVCLEEEFNSNVTFGKFTVDQLLFEEGINIDVLTCYLAESPTRLVKKKRTTMDSRGNMEILVPHNSRTKNMSNKDKISSKKDFKKDRNPDAVRKEIKSKKKVKKASCGKYECNSIIRKDLLLNESSEFVSTYTKNSLQSYFGEHATVNLNKDGNIMVDLKVQTEESLIEALNQEGISYVIEGEGQVRTVKLVAQEEEPVVESYYAEAKMTDEAVVKACEAMVKNSDDDKVKKFAKGLLDFYKKEGSFTPDQVSGLQNIMKNASFHMAKKDD